MEMDTENIKPNQKYQKKREKGRKIKDDHQIKPLLDWL